MRPNNTLYSVSVAVAFWGSGLAAQVPAPEAATPSTITAATLAHQLTELVAESLQGRRTPSVSLERTARYLATQFEALGLRSGIRRFRDGGVGDPWIQRYPLPGQIVELDRAATRLVFTYAPRVRGRAVVTEQGSPVRSRIAVPLTAARFALPWVPEMQTLGLFAPQMVLMTGRPTEDFLRRADLANRAVLYVPPSDLDSTARQALLQQLHRASRGVVLLSTGDSAQIAARQEPQSLRLLDAYLEAEGDDAPHRWAIEVPAEILANPLSALGVDLVQARRAREPAARVLDDLQVLLKQVFDPADSAAPAAPNVVGLLQGSDSLLRKECVVVTASLDQRGPQPVGVDSMKSVTDASTANLAGLLELARAFRALPTAPKRSVLFLAASGSSPGQTFWGSHYYLSKLFSRDGVCLPILDLTLDLSVGGLVSQDTAVIGGINDVQLPLHPAWVATAHPELRLVVTDGGTIARPISDAFAFARRGFPSLLVSGGQPEDGPARATLLSARDLEEVARLLGLTFYVSQESAMANERPQWTRAGRQRALATP